MNATIAEPIQSVLDRIPVQEVLERVPHDVIELLPERFQPEPPSSSHRRLWLTALVLVGAVVAFMLLRRRSAPEEDVDLDLREPGAAGDVSLVGRPDASVLRP